MNSLFALFALTLAQDDPAEFRKNVAQAIDQGVDWLKKQQQHAGDFGESKGPTYGPGKAYPNKPGITAFALLALLKSDVPYNDPVITKGLAFLQDYVGQKGNTISNYDRGVILMALEAFHESGAADILRKKGQKTTERVGDFKEPKYTPSPPIQAFIQGIVKPLQEEQTKQGGWRYGHGFGLVGSEEDISCTQIVLLGLKSATRMKSTVDPTAFKKAMDFVLRSQEKDGPKVERPADYTPQDRGTYASLGSDRARGWAYIKSGSKPEEEKVCGSMTCAGIGSLLIAKSILGKSLGKKGGDEVDQCIYDGFAWLSTHWSVSENPVQGKPRHFYHLYGIERVGTLGLFEKISGHSWYREGAEVLLGGQKADGSWDNKDEIVPTNTLDTCYALLFLRRGTASVGDVITGRSEGKPNSP
ncbi:MAG TPA: prenyltransferase/squalene oxidase repeat-containing protein [Planctomycetota bacterium]|nr:prenyltransferase/squalene oxidase repeat-containing protein [Planctomycetota bacterium]